MGSCAGSPTLLTPHSPNSTSTLPWDNSRDHSLHFLFSFAPRDPLEKISPGTFLFHFPSLCYASGRKLCYLCFHVEGEGEEDSWYDLGVFQNKVRPLTSRSRVSWEGGIEWNEMSHRGSPRGLLLPPSPTSSYAFGPRAPCLTLLELETG